MSSEVFVVLAADDGYARALATAGRSLIANLGADRRLCLSVLDMGFSPENRQKLMSSFGHKRVRVNWVDSARELVAGLPTRAWFSTAAYARFLIPELLPESVERALYLDCDLIARRCVGELYEIPMKDRVALAVPDMGAPFVCSPWGTPHWFEFGRNPADANFNSGVLLMDLVAWRREKLREQLLDYVRSDRYGGNLDQEALNAVLGNRIGHLDPHWNQQGEVHKKLYSVALPYHRDLVESVRADPWIVHYSTWPKPWILDCDHPWTAEWFRYLDQTAFAGWRPQGPSRRQQLVGRARHIVGRVGRRLGLL
ncbi:MAG TPA: glycosyltransferase family 8 protein [Polyangiaceae bacterium]|nr:glycosyltransferase family 8 protein [Polyangiaceae bacterium]